MSDTISMVSYKKLRSIVPKPDQIIYTVIMLSILIIMVGLLCYVVHITNKQSKLRENLNIHYYIWTRDDYGRIFKKLNTGVIYHFVDQALLENRSLSSIKKDLEDCQKFRTILKEEIFLEYAFSYVGIFIMVLGFLIAFTLNILSCINPDIHLFYKVVNFLLPVFTTLLYPIFLPLLKDLLKININRKYLNAVKAHHKLLYAAIKILESREELITRRNSLKRAMSSIEKQM